jgi:hypothetical protein
MNVFRNLGTDYGTGRSRRDFLAIAAGGIAAANSRCLVAGEAPERPKEIAAIVTAFRYRSHAHGIAGRWLEGMELDGQSQRPASRMVALFTDQVPKNDLSRALCEKHGVPIYPTIGEALCRGGTKLAVDGVLIIGEHGTYPFDEQGRHLYPRRRFFEETVAVLREAGRAVPVFMDKHLAYNWPDAKWIYDQAVELKLPFMAGSSVPNAWRAPAVDIELGAEIEEAVTVGFGGIESYGFHTLEMLQAMIERRQGGETGVAAVETLEGDAVWKAAEEKRWSRSLLDAALATGLRTKPGSPEKNCKQPTAFLIEYRSGLKATVLMLSGHVSEYLFAAQCFLASSRQSPTTRGFRASSRQNPTAQGFRASSRQSPTAREAKRREPVAFNFRLQEGFPSGHFATLARGIDRMFTSGRPSWPVERTLLTTGVLDAALTSRFENGRRMETPHLAIAYPAGPAWQEPPRPKTGPPIG